MKYLFQLGHPAHYHLFKKPIVELKKRGHQVAILIKGKDVLEDLLQSDGLKYNKLLKRDWGVSIIGKSLNLIEVDTKLFNFALKFSPDVLIGTSYANSHVGKILNIPVINVNEDDYDVVPYYSKFSYPWSTVILTPDSCRTGNWESKSIKYAGYHELSYLHPNNFKAERSVVEKYILPLTPYFLIRLAKLTAHHDDGIRGISHNIKVNLIDMLKRHGRILISSERALDPHFEEFRININPSDIHHIIAFASFFIGDSQTMAAEAGVLGTPFIRFNDFVGRIGYLNELEQHYRLGFGIKPDNEEKLYSKIQEILNTPNLKEEWRNRRQKMLSEKIDVAAFMLWFFENYPDSVKVMKENPNYQLRFR
jgi:predicted glycosyltransferase